MEAVRKRGKEKVGRKPERTQYQALREGGKEGGREVRKSAEQRRDTLRF